MRRLSNFFAVMATIAVVAPPGAHATPPADTPEQGQQPAAVDPALPMPPARSQLDTIGPLIVGGLALVSLGFAVYGFTASCDLRAQDGVCLRGTEMAVGPTVAFAVTGVSGITAAAVWWILATPRPAARVSIAPGSVVLRF